MTTFLDQVKELDRLVIPKQNPYELLDVEAIKDLPPPKWQVEKWFQQRGFTVVYGPSGTGKTFVVLDIALSVSLGRPWFSQPVVNGPVIYVAGEGAGGLGKRIGAWQRDRDVRNVDSAPFFAVTHVPNLMVRDEVSAFIEAVRRIEPAQIVFDTLARCMSGGDENSSKDMGVVIGGVERIREELGTGIILVHHTNKGGMVERGSGALRGAADTMLSLAPDDEAITLSVDKQKDGEPPDPLTLKLTPILFADSCVLRLDNGTVSTGELTKDQRRALKALSHFQEGASRRDWMEASELKPGTFAAVLDALVNKAMVDPPGPDMKPKRYRIRAEGSRAL